MNTPVADLSCCNGMFEALSDYYKFHIFCKRTIQDIEFNKIDLVAFPGGTGDADLFHRILGKKSSLIQNYVSDGGKYLGICMGAYWADQDYFNLLEGARAVQYIKRPGTDTRRPHAKAIDIKWQRKPHKMFFYDGCAIVGDRSKFKTIATYANGDPMAIIQNNIGLIGCHPESEKHWYDDYSWMPRHWHKNTHHKLLLDFVNQLMQNN